MLQTLRDSKGLHCKRVRDFYGVREVKQLQEHFWLKLAVTAWHVGDLLGVCIISYHAFGPLTGCFGQFCLFIVSLHVLACAYAIALPHPTLSVLFLLGGLVEVLDFYNPTLGTPSILGYVSLRLACQTGSYPSLTPCP